MVDDPIRGHARGIEQMRIWDGSNVVIAVPWFAREVKSGKARSNLPERANPVAGWGDLSNR